MQQMIKSIKDQLIVGQISVWNVLGYIDNH